MPRVPTVYGEEIEHPEGALRAAAEELEMQLARLKVGARRAQEAIVAIEDLWCGADGTRAMRGPRVLPTAETLAKVAAMMRDKRPEVRTQVLITFAAALEDAAVVMDTILIGLDDAAATVRVQAARLLEKVKKLPREVVPQVRGRLLDPVGAVRWSVVGVLVGRVGAEELATALLDSVPAIDAHRVAVHDWLRAAHAVEPMPKKLAERARELEAIVMK